MFQHQKQEAHLVPTPSGRSALRSSNPGVPENKSASGSQEDVKKDDVATDLGKKFEETKIDDLDPADDKLTSAEMLAKLLASHKKPDLNV